jgi:hypothetical protein
MALLVTALLGIAGYMVQNKASIAANATQHEIIQETAERQRVEDKATKQLERVHEQQALYLNPMYSALVSRTAITIIFASYMCFGPLARLNDIFRSLAPTDQAMFSRLCVTVSICSGNTPPRLGARAARDFRTIRLQVHPVQGCPICCDH